MIDLPWCGNEIIEDDEECDGSAGVELHQQCEANCTLTNLPWCGNESEKRFNPYWYVE